MSYKCYLGRIQMPQTPGKLSIKVKGQNKTLTLLNEGEINFLKAPGLTEITLPLTFPMLTGEKPPQYYLGALETLIASKIATQFIMTRTAPNGRLLFDTNIKVSVEDYTVTENASNGLDISVEVKLKQYRDYGTKTIKVQTATGKTNSASTTNNKSNTAAVVTERPADTAPKVKTHTVVYGDTLWGMAKKYYGNGMLYTKIYDANRDITDNPNHIWVGQVYKIPE